MMKKKDDLRREEVIEGSSSLSPKMAEFQMSDSNVLTKPFIASPIHTAQSLEKKALRIDQGRQNRLVQCISKGLIAHVQLRSENTSLTHPNSDGLYPLVAAIYGVHPTLVKYIEDELGDVALDQWKMVDLKIINEKIAAVIPQKLTDKHVDTLADWYDKYMGAPWCLTYDFSHNFLSWLGYHDWSTRKEYLKESYDKYEQPNVPARILISHDNAVEAVKQELISFKNKVETKVMQARNKLEEDQSSSFTSVVSCSRSNLM